MNRSKKLAITLAVLAAFGGNFYVQPEQGFAAEYVITGDEINHLGDEWRDESTSIALKDSVNDNVIILKGVEYDNSIYGGWGDKENSSNNTLIFIDSEIGKDSDKSNWGQIGGAWAGPYDPNEPQKTYNADKNTVIVYDSKIHHAIFGGYSRGGSASGNTIVIAGNSIVYGENIPDNSGANEPVSGQYIYGGYSWINSGDLSKNGGTGGKVENNIIIIKDNVYDTTFDKFSHIALMNSDIYWFGLSEFVEELYIDFVKNYKPKKYQKERSKLLEEIYKYMHKKKHVKSKVIADNFNVSLRSVQRYMLDLNDIYRTIGYDYKKNEYYVTK